MIIDLPKRAIIALSGCNNIEGEKRLILFNNDVEGAAISFNLFAQLQAQLKPDNNTAIMYHAACFICAAHRVGKLLDALSATRDCFSPAITKVIRAERRKNRTFFESFTKPRNSIEHIDEASRNKTKLAFYNLDNERFHVINDVTIEINREKLDSILSIRDNIANAIIRAYPNPILKCLDH